MYRPIDMPKQIDTALALPAPTGGLNDYDPIANMDASFMLTCMNLYPDTGLVTVRPGYQEVQTGLIGAVKSIMEYTSLDGTIKRFAVTDSWIYDINTPGAPSAVKAVTNGKVNFTNYGTQAGNYMIVCNGTDPAILYDGSTWVDFTTAVTPSGPGQINGIAPNEIANVAVHNARLFFVRKNKMEAYFLPIDSVGGVASPLFVGGIFSKGGYLLSLMRWSSDTGAGLDDRLIFITSNGELASYSGSDPSDAANWNLDSVFYLAPPLGDRAITANGGDILILCRRGLVPASTLLYGSAAEVAYSGTFTKLINRAIQRLTAQWQQLPYPIEVFVHVDLQWITINIYDSDLRKKVQYVMNAITGAWGRFDYPVRTIRTIDGITYMGTDDGRVLVITKNFYQDNVHIDGTGGSPIEWSGMSAYTYLNDPTALKHADMIRPVFQAEVKPSFRLRVLPDWRTDEYTVPVPPGVAVANARWDISLWDSAVWAGLENVYRPWMSANQLGFAFAWQMKGSTSSGLGISAIEWTSQRGGMI